MLLSPLEIKLKLKRNIDLDLTARCPLMCPMCWRQGDVIAKKHGHDMSMEDFLKVVEFAKSGAVKGFIYFAGALSDPIHHPNFIEFLKICAENKLECEVQTASSFKSKEWFIEAFKAHPNARWQFGIDGLPEDSHKYRVNQDGKKLFDIMEESIKYLNEPPIWQYIVFKYNENDIDEAKAIAKELGVEFMLVNSSRWLGTNDPYRPSKEHSLDLKDE